MRISDWSSDVCSSDLENILVPSARAVDDDDLVLAQRRRDAFGGGDGVRRLQRGDDALQLGQLLKARERFFVGHRLIPHAADLVQPGMLGADAGVVEAGRDAVRLGDLAVLVLEQIGLVAMEATGATPGEAGGVLAVEALARGLDAD